MRQAVIVAMSVLLCLHGLSSNASNVNEWENIHPAGPDNSLGGTAFGLSTSADGYVFFQSGFDNYYARSDSSLPWQKFEPTLNGSPIRPTEFIHSTSTPGKITAYIFNQGALRSTDYGLTWTVLANLSNTALIGVSPIDETHFFAWDFANSTLLESIDDGISWQTKATIGLNAPRSLQIDSSNPQVQYVIDSNMIKKSIDGGTTWVESSNGLSANSSFINYKLAPSDQSRIYGASNNTHLVFVSDDGANSWAEYFVIGGIPAGPMNAIDVDPQDANKAVAVGGYGGVFQTTDGGLNWDQLFEYPDYQDWYSVVVKNDGEVNIAGSGGMGLVTADSDVEPSNVGFSDFSMQYLLAAPGNNARLYGGGRNGVAVYEPASQKWVVRQGPFDSRIRHIAVDAQDEQHALVGTFFSGIQETSDAGLSWNEVPFPDTPTPPTTRTITYLEIAPSDPDVIYARTVFGLHRTVDGGQTWSLILESQQLPFSQQRNALTIAPDDSDRIYLTTENQGILYSADGGATWNDTQGVFQVDNMSDVEVDPNDTSVVYASTINSFLWRSSDFGQTWESLGPGAFLGSFRDIILDPFIPGRIYAQFNDAEVHVYLPSTDQWTNLGAPVAKTCSSLDEIQSDCQIVLHDTRQGYVTVQIRGELFGIQVDSDLDGIGDDVDNCTLVANTGQIDTDNDTFGNACDGDFNNDGLVNFIDFALFSGAFLSTDALFDLNLDGSVNFLDFSILSGQFLMAPGPNVNGVAD